MKDIPSIVRWKIWLLPNIRLAWIFQLTNITSAESSGWVWPSAAVSPTRDRPSVSPNFRTQVRFPGRSSTEVELQASASPHTQGYKPVSRRIEPEQGKRLTSDPDSSEVQHGRAAKLFCCHFRNQGRLATALVWIHRALWSFLRSDCRSSLARIYKRLSGSEKDWC